MALFVGKYPIHENETILFADVSKEEIESAIKLGNRRVMPVTVKAITHWITVISWDERTELFNRGDVRVSDYSEYVQNIRKSDSVQLSLI